MYAWRCLCNTCTAGRAVAELIVEGDFTSLDLARFSFDRVLANKPIFETGIV